MGGLVLHLGDEFRNLGRVADLLQHLECRLVGAAMRRAPQAGDARRDAGEGIGARRAGKAHRRRGGVLLVVGVQDEDPVHGARQDRVHHIFLAGHGKAHAQEVRRIGQRVLRVNEGLADVILVGHGGDGRQLGDHPVAGDLALARIIDVGRVMVEGRHGADHRHHHCHRVRVAAEALVEPGHLLVHHGVVGDVLVEFLALRGGRQLAVIEQVAGFQEVAVLGQLLDRVATVEQHALVAVDVGDLGFAGRGGGEARVEGEGAGLGVELGDVHHVRPDGAGFHRHLDLASSEFEDCLLRIVSHCGLPSLSFSRDELLHRTIERSTTLT